MKHIRDLLIIFLITALLLELIFRLYFDDFLYYAANRFLFIEPYSFENKSDNFWAYRENAEFQVAAVYDFGAYGIFPEYQCTYRTNNLGLVQDTDFEPGTKALLVMGDSFTEGHGGCPWFYNLEKELDDLPVVNGGLQGTGFKQWVALLDYLRGRGVSTTGVVIIAISDDFFRPEYTWPQDYLGCLNLRGECDARNVWGPLERPGNTGHLISATEQRYRKHFSEKEDKSAFMHWMRHKLYIAKFGELVWSMLEAKSPRRRERELPSYTMEAIKTITTAVEGNFRLILVPQRDEVGLRALNNRSMIARAALKEAGIEWSECKLTQGDYMKFDGHPNAGGYRKIRACASEAIWALNSAMH